MRSLLLETCTASRDRVVEVWHRALRRLPEFARLPETTTRDNVERCLDAYVALLADGDEAPLRAFAESLADQRFDAGFPMHLPLWAAGRFADGVVAALEAAGSTLEPALLTEIQRLTDRFNQYFTSRYGSRMLSAAEDAFRNLLEQATDAVVLLDADLRVVEANPAFADLLEADAPTAFEGRRFPEFFAEGDARTVEEALGNLAEDAAIVPLRTRLRSATGRTVRVRLSAHRSHARHRPTILVTLRDVTRDEERLARSVQHDNLVAVGRLAASMTHELNNPLTWVMGNLQQAREDVARIGASVEETLGDMLDDALVGTRRMAAIIRDLRAFLGGAEAEAAAYEPRDVLDLAVRIGSVQGRGRVRVALECDDLPRCVGIPGRLSQVFVNLVVNAIEATADTPRPEVRVRARPAKDRDGYVVEVEDNGRGIPPDLRAHLFEPFMTAGKKQGMGLGLWITREIVEEHGGTIEVTSRPGATRFTVFVARDGGGRWQPLRAETPVASAGRRRILLVDDEEILRRALARQFRRTCEVTAVGSAEEALDAIEARDAAFDVVVSDVGLPGMDGIALWRTVAERWPDLGRRFVLISGVSDFEGVPASVPCLRKPFSRQELEQAIERVAAAPRADRTG